MRLLCPDDVGGWRADDIEAPFPRGNLAHVRPGVRGPMQISTLAQLAIGMPMKITPLPASRCGNPRAAASMSALGPKTETSSEQRT